MAWRICRTAVVSFHMCELAVSERVAEADRRSERERDGGQTWLMDDEDVQPASRSRHCTFLKHYKIFSSAPSVFLFSASLSPSFVTNFM